MARELVGRDSRLREVAVHRDASASVKTFVRPGGILKRASVTGVGAAAADGVVVPRQWQILQPFGGSGEMRTWLGT